MGGEQLARRTPSWFGKTCSSNTQPSSASRSRFSLNVRVRASRPRTCAKRYASRCSCQCSCSRHAAHQRRGLGLGLARSRARPARTGPRSRRSRAASPSRSCCACTHSTSSTDVLQRPVGLHVDRLREVLGGRVGLVFVDRVRLALQRLVGAEDARDHRPAQPRQVLRPARCGDARRRSSRSLTRSSRDREVARAGEVVEIVDDRRHAAGDGRVVGIEAERRPPQQPVATGARGGGRRAPSAPGRRARGRRTARSSARRAPGRRSAAWSRNSCSDGPDARAAVGVLDDRRRRPPARCRRRARAAACVIRVSRVPNVNVSPCAAHAKRR